MKIIINLINKLNKIINNLFKYKIILQLETLKLKFKIIIFLNKIKTNKTIKFIKLIIVKKLNLIIFQIIIN